MDRRETMTARDDDYYSHRYGEDGWSYCKARKPLRLPWHTPRPFNGPTQCPACGVDRG